MRRKIILITAVTALLIIGGALVTAVEANNSQNSQKETNQQTYTGSENGIKTYKLQRIRNMLQELIGLCKGDTHTISTLHGTLQKNGSRFYIDTIELSFGPIWYTKYTIKNDYDLDSKYETFYQELNGLVGTNITVEGHYQSEYWITVFSINNITYREPGKSLWSQGKYGPQ